MTNLSPFIQGSYHLVSFIHPMCRYGNNGNIFHWTFSRAEFYSCRIKCFITKISNKTTNELTIYATLCGNVAIFYRQELASLIQMQEKLKTCRNLKWNFSSSCFIVDDTHVNVVWLHVVVFIEHDILHFCNNVHLLKCSVEEPQHCFNFFNFSNQTGMQVPKFLFALDK